MQNVFLVFYKHLTQTEWWFRTGYSYSPQP